VLDCQVLVCGAGCAGLGAALAAARSGARTLLVERAGFAGGIVTSVGLPFFDGIADKKQNRVVVRGIGLELFSKMGGCAPDAVLLKSHNPLIDSVEKFKVLTDRLLTGEGAHLKVLYHTVAAGVATADGRITEVTLANKAGLVRVKPEVVVDCTGDADLAAWSGAPVEKSAELQPMTLHFRIGNVKYGPDTRKQCREALEKAHARGDLPLFYGPGLVSCFAPDEAYVHAIRVPADGTDPDDLTRAEIQGRADAWKMFEVWKKDVPGFEDAYYISSGPFIGVRETRRIVGEHVLTEQDILANRRFDDAVATGCWYLDRHPNKVTVGGANAGPAVQPDPYDIPYRSLVPKKVSNLLVAGRCHSATASAMTSTRVTATAMAMGEGAGTAAAQAVARRTTPAELKGEEVRKLLESRGAGPVHVP
jgi:hypothetical protein